MSNTINSNQVNYGLKIMKENDDPILILKLINNQVVDYRVLDLGDNVLDKESYQQIYHAKTEENYLMSQLFLKKYDDKGIICLQSISNFSENYLITLGIVEIF